MQTKYSKILQQNITMDEKEGILTCEDGVVYKKRELLLLKHYSDGDKYFIHQVKKMFEGEIIE